ncbi:efflux RND transporter periplasmic adaptor subunit [Gloeocapsa sp. PCC 73106]|uniref:efflux RND transporter periplasmic adaptor subunit n=1 Tax=Gloeocapsa sp. PCC 73106 TaxID=102232 RepID=UPI0002AC9479|nr:efflux RND transporter periplasmic adaptor subunit [Gloeocapsa sp. PCC 73106]ELR96269.1 RND family efflux transporter, MFP subunit [Gloeocapsa sp. PCC 73106]
MPFPRKSPVSLVWLLVIILTGGFLLLATGLYLNQKRSLSQADLEQLTIPVEQSDLEVNIRASGTVEPIASVNISPKNPGILEKLLVEQGDVVQSGQLLAIMESSEISAQKNEAAASLNEAIASLAEFESRFPQEIEQLAAGVRQTQALLSQSKAINPAQIDQARAQLEASQARFDLSQQRINRNEYLIQQGAISQDEFDASINEFKNAQADLKDAEQRLIESENTQNPEIDSLRADLSRAESLLLERQNTATGQRARLQANVDARRAQLELLEIRYQDTLIKAPFDGIISQRYVTEGAFVTPTTSASASVGATSTSVLALAQGLEVIAKVPEVDLSQLFAGQRVTIYADAYPNQPFDGKVRLVAPEAVVEENVTSFEVRITLLNGEQQLRSKMNVDVVFIGKELENVVSVPTVAIVTQEGQTGVMVMGDRGEAIFKPVTLGLTVDNQTEILEGLTPGERVFIDSPP